MSYNIRKSGISSECHNTWTGIRFTSHVEYPKRRISESVISEYGARLLVHPAGTYPTLQRGGVVLQPGTKDLCQCSHGGRDLPFIGKRGHWNKKKRKIDRLPWPYGECTYEFEHSPLASHLRKTGQYELMKHRIYTYERYSIRLDGLSFRMAQQPTPVLYIFKEMATAEKFGPMAAEANYSGQGDGPNPVDLKYIK
ncbi:acid-sensing ion channel 4 [Caerostris extrusa]|uniref:Acid-sensing ion channel 4 n=1 Tax=Caerostris extrusa TaxID=172846 RepID=A0AAV4S6B1_CAEEX|nr:acid-sensing ion channel 4 [Caerostris extrusa]